MANGSKLKKPWNKDEVLERLADNAVRAVSYRKDDGTMALSHLEAPSTALVGLKLWGYIGFLGLRLERI